jgi:hypothetical protein
MSFLPTITPPRLKATQQDQCGDKVGHRIVLDGTWLSCILTLFTKSRSIAKWHGYHDEQSRRCRYFSQMKHTLDILPPLSRVNGVLVAWILGHALDTAVGSLWSKIRS